LALNHDYILVYAKDAAKEMHSLKWRTAQSEEYLKRYKELDPDGKRLWNCIISRGKTKEIFCLATRRLSSSLARDIPLYMKFILITEERSFNTLVTIKTSALSI